MNFKSEYRQRFITPSSLKFFQTFLSLGRSKSYTSNKKIGYGDLFFIIGSGRCGSTLLRSLLISDESIHIPPESSALPTIVKKYARYQGLDWKDLVSVCCGEFTSNPAFEYWHLDLQNTCIRLQKLKKEDRSLQKIITSIYEEHKYKFKPNAQIIGDKTTFNTLRLDWIHKVYPNAKFINLIRDGRDVLSSYLRSGLENNVQLITWKWNQSLIRAQSFKKKNKNKNTYLEIKYEDLVSFPQHTCDNISDFLGINSINIKLHNTNLPSDDLILKHHENVNHPISDSSIGKWKNELSDKNKLYAEKHMKKNLKKYGYFIG